LDLEFGMAVASLEDAPIDYWPIPLCSSLVDNGGEGTDGTLFVGYNDGTVAEWSVATRICTAVRVKDVGLLAGVKAVAARVVTGNARSGGDGDDGVELVTGHYDGSVRVYSAGGRVAGKGGAVVGAASEPTPGEVSGAVLMGARFDVYCFADTADGTQLIAGSRNGLAGVWDVRSGVCIATLGSEGSWEKNACVAVSSDGRVIALGHGHKGAFVWSCRCWIQQLLWTSS
jgi:WD40 repeat protein